MRLTHLLAITLCLGALAASLRVEAKCENSRYEIRYLTAHHCTDWLKTDGETIRFRDNKTMKWHTLPATATITERRTNLGIALDKALKGKTK